MHGNIHEEEYMEWQKRNDKQESLAYTNVACESLISTYSSPSGDL